MNPRILWHLLKSDWRGLRTLVLCFWGVLLIAAWFPLTYSAGSFRTPPFTRVGIPGSSARYGYPAISEFDSAFAQWSQMMALWALVATSLSLAGMLGCHDRDRAFARPVRRREWFAARGLAFLLFLILPLLGVLAAIPLVQGFGPDAVWVAVSRGAPLIVAKLGAVCLFGAVCGSWWRFAGGMAALHLTSMILPLLGLRFAIPHWLGHPFLMLDSILRSQLLPAVAIVIVLLASSRHMRTGMRMALAIAAMLLSSRAVHWKTPKSYFTQAAPALADWSGKVRPVFADTEYRGELNGDISPRQHHIEPGKEAYLLLDTPWNSAGLPEGVFADWARSGKAELISGGQVISSTPAGQAPPYRIIEDFRRAANFGVLADALGKDGKPAVINRQLSASGLPGGEIPNQDALSAVEPGRHEDTILVTELSGVAYRFEKLADVPLGDPVEVKVDGRALHIRRLDHADGIPMADVAYVIPEIKGAGLPPGFANEYLSPDLAWIPLIYLPVYDEYLIAGNRFHKREVLVPGEVAVRQIFTMAWRPQELAPKEDLAGMRFILLRRVDVARMKETFRDEPKTLLLGGSSESDWTLRHSGEGPPSAKRPDPATATDKELGDWLRHIDGVYDYSDHKARDLAEFVPRQLPTLLSQPSRWSHPSAFQGEAISLACPEGRRGEVIAALLKRNRPDETNWIPDVIMERGWVDEAAPQIRELAATGPIQQNYFSQMLIAMLEDPQTYPVLLDVPAWRSWPQFYQVTRRLPGIEPGLSKAIERFYHDAAKRNFRTPGRTHGAGPPELQPELGEKFYYCLVPAAHGMPDAFARLLETWQAFNDTEKRRHEDRIRDAVLLPGQAGDWKSTVGALAGREPGDFRYDPLARLWVPADEPKQ